MSFERAGRGNARVKHLRRLVREPALRRDEGLCVVEGLKLARELLDSGRRIRLVLAGDSLDSEPELLAALGDRAEHALRAEDSVLDSVADTRTPQGLLLVVDRPARHALPPPGGRALLVGWELQDPGNVGALVRAAAASGCAGALFARSPDGALADPFSPRALRASAGAAFRLPVLEWEGEPQDLAERLRSEGWRPAALVPRGGRPFDEARLDGPVALVVGSEAHGLPRELETAGEALSLPLEAGVESLGAAAAGAVACFEAARQRRLAQAGEEG